MPRRNLEDSREERKLEWDVIQRDKIVQSFEIYARSHRFVSEDTLDFTAENEISVLGPRVVEWLYSNSVSSQDQSSFLDVPQRYRKHSVEHQENLRSVLLKPV